VPGPNLGKRLHRSFVVKLGRVRPDHLLRASVAECYALSRMAGGQRWLEDQAKSLRCARVSDEDIQAIEVRAERTIGGRSATVV
jgi:hypothetical protein